MQITEKILTGFLQSNASLQPSLTSELSEREGTRDFFFFSPAGLNKSSSSYYTTPPPPSRGKTRSGTGQTKMPKGTKNSDRHACYLHSIIMPYRFNIQTKYHFSDCVRAVNKFPLLPHQRRLCDGRISRLGPDQLFF